MKTIDEITADIDKITAAFERLNKACDKAADAGCLDTEGELFSAIWDSFDALIWTIDTDMWIAWYLWENECGKNAMKAGYDEENKPITNSRELAELIHKAQTR
jgi:hypothetical protein